MQLKILCSNDDVHYLPCNSTLIFLFLELGEKWISFTDYQQTAWEIG